MQSFSQAQTQAQAQQIYSGQVLPGYHALLLAQTNNCPLQFQNGTLIWSTPQGGAPQPIPCPALVLVPQVRPGSSPPFYYQNGPGILYFALGFGISRALVGVPYSAIQQLQSVQNPSQLIASLVKTYHSILLSSPDNCPIKTQSGYYLWTD
jgi:hypothetical protein